MNEKDKGIFDPFLIAPHTVTCQLIIDLGLTI